MNRIFLDRSMSYNRGPKNKGIYLRTAWHCLALQLGVHDSSCHSCRSIWEGHSLEGKCLNVFCFVCYLATCFEMAFQCKFSDAGPCSKHSCLWTVLRLDGTGTLHKTEDLRVQRGPNFPGKVAKAGSVEPRSIMLSPISRAPVAVRLQVSLEVLSYIKVWKPLSLISDLDLDFLKLGMLSSWAQEERQQDDLCRISPCSFCILKNHNYLTVLARTRKAVCMCSKH